MVDAIANELVHTGVPHQNGHRQAIHAFCLGGFSHGGAAVCAAQLLGDGLPQLQQQSRSAWPTQSWSQHGVAMCRFGHVVTLALLMCSRACSRKVRVSLGVFGSKRRSNARSADAAEPSGAVANMCSSGGGVLAGVTRLPVLAPAVEAQLAARVPRCASKSSALPSFSSFRLKPPPPRSTSAAPSAPIGIAAPAGAQGARLAVRDTPDRGKIIVSLDAIEPGDLVLAEAPALMVVQAGNTATLADLQSWVDNLARLGAAERVPILELHYPPQAADGGTLASLVGAQGEGLEAVLRCPEGVTFDEIWRLMRIIECNAFGFDNEDGTHKELLLPRVARLNHSCLPNVLCGPGSQGGGAEVRALVAIAPGDELNISYIGLETLLSPVAERRHPLQGRWQFSCGCQRCRDVDGLRAFRCSSCAQSSVHSQAEGGLCSPCCQCGQQMTSEAAEAAFASEASLGREALGVRQAVQAAAGSLGSTLQAGDAAAMQRVLSGANAALAQCEALTTAHPQVDPSHYLAVGTAKEASKLCAVLGEAFVACGDRPSAEQWWARAAAGLREALDAEFRAVPVPRDSRTGELLGLSRLYRRLGQREAVRQCLQQALAGMRAIHWSCNLPTQRAALAEMQQGIRAQLAELQ
mmetsp:Transcript_52484/g.148702  ORF Transcript_52484/g.148702 Transcript_52484/m.148702 type:complete len:636 (-) Transcript_52484:57-1964(-)